MAKITTKNRAQKQARKSMRKRAKDKQRQKTHAHTALSENAIQHQMLSEFGNVQNFVKNVQALADLMKVDEDLKKLRYDPEKVYAHFDLAADRAALADAYEKADDPTAYAEEFQDFWREKRRAILPEMVTETFVEQCEKMFKKLMLTKKGQKKEYRAVLAGSLLVRSHRVAMTPTDAPLEDNSLWELILLATIKENIKELPEPAPSMTEEKATSTAPAAEAENETDTEPRKTEEQGEDNGSPNATSGS